MSIENFWLIIVSQGAARGQQGCGENSPRSLWAGIYKSISYQMFLSLSLSGIPVRKSFPISLIGDCKSKANSMFWAWPVHNHQAGETAGQEPGEGGGGGGATPAPEAGRPHRQGQLRRDDGKPA